MECQKVTNLLGTTSANVPTFTTKKWIEVHNHSSNAEDRYKPNKQIGFKTSMLRSDSCDFSDSYIILKGIFTVTNPNNNVYDKKIAFMSNSPFASCISKIIDTLTDNAEDLDIVMRMYNLLEHS